jgi:hypothetical protein
MNSQTTFRNALKKLGLDYKAGKIFSIMDAEAAPKAIPKKSKKSAKATFGSSTTSDVSNEKGSDSEAAKKRRSDAGVGDEDKAGKKPKTEEDED